MNRILTTWGSSGQPFTSPTSLDHLQDAFYEGFKSVVRGLIGPQYDATKAYALFGCYYNGTTNTLTEGAIFFEEEIWFVPYWSPGLACGGGSVPILNKTTTWASTDPLDYKDGSSHNTHRIRQITATCGTSGSGDVCDVANLCRVPLPRRMVESTGSVTAASLLPVNFRQQSSFLFSGGVTAAGASFDLDSTGATHGAVAEVYVTGAIDTSATFNYVSTVTSTPVININDPAIATGANTVILIFTYIKPSNTATEFITVEVKSY